MTLPTAINVGSILAGFGVAAGTGALFIFGEVPRVRNDILRQLPFFDTYYDRTIAPEDNVSLGLHLEYSSIGADADLNSPALLNYLARRYASYLLDQYDSSDWFGLCCVEYQ
ncbi:unnamed protein product [Penicillium salamii]|nr:unnamed protein product [Penicillium salamii]